MFLREKRELCAIGLAQGGIYLLFHFLSRTGIQTEVSIRRTQEGRGELT
jgi:hypothetical protein